MPRFSIVIAAYGNAEYLPACLESVRSQDYADWEAIVIPAFTFKSSVLR